jgi:hypothetical protein
VLAFFNDESAREHKMSSMPWYISLFLFLLSPAYATLVKDRLWLRIQDRWASRSVRSLKRRIGI